MHRKALGITVLTIAVAIVFANCRQRNEDAGGAVGRDPQDSWLGLERKGGAPLEPIELEAEGALTRYKTVAVEIRTLSGSLLERNERVATAKEKAEHGSLPTAELELAHLEASARRHEEATTMLCNAYLGTKREKAVKEKEKEEARRALKEHRNRVFGTYQAAINTFLVRFNADFRVERLTPSDARGVPSSAYGFVVNKKHVGTARTETPEPSFATALSSGDRNTLALK